MHSVDKSSTLFLVKTTPNKPERPDKDAFKQVFADNLFEARNDTKFTQAAVGRCIDMSANSYAKYEQADSMLPLAYLAPICERLYISSWQLLTGRPQGKIPELPARLRNSPAAKARARRLRNAALAKARAEKARNG